MKRDFSLPRDLRQLRKTEGYSAIVGVGAHDAQNVVRISTATNIESLLIELQKGSWFTLFYRQLIWTPGQTAAQTVARGVEEDLARAGLRVRDHWYRADESVVDQAIADHVRSLRCRSWTHAELKTRLRRRQIEEAERFAAGLP